jgi:bidirectional [NiFe] hydrogenase diaphorase subunit
MPPDTQTEKTLERAMARHHYSGDALIEVLHVAQQIYGYLSPPVLESIARSLKLPPSRVLGVATFYHLFRFEPRMNHCAVVCLGTACYEAGAQHLMASAAESCTKKRSGWTVEAGRCLGSCGLAPVVIVDGAARARIAEPELQDLIEDAQ